MGTIKVVMAIIVWCLLTGCHRSGKTEITNTYMTTDYWDRRGAETGSNSFEIIRMKVKKDSILDPFAAISQGEILDKTEEDPSFLFYSNIRLPEGESYKGRKIYFDKFNGFYWNAGHYLNEQKVKTFGNLQKGTWYRLSGLSPFRVGIYVYVDSADKVHRFNITPSNY